MANVLNRTTKQFLASVNTPDYSEADWIVNPDLTAVAGYPSKYWDIQGDAVVLLDDAGRTASAEAEAVVVKDQADTTAAALATKALAASNGLKSPADGASDADRLRALEFLVYGG
jgi:hypothetical protein